MEISNENFVKWPAKLGTPLNRRNQNKYCRFHRDHGHETKECRHFKGEIEDLIQRGYLRQFESHDQNGRNNQRRDGHRHDHQNDCQEASRQEANRPERDPPARIIATITGGPAAGGTSSSSHKAYAREVNIAEGPFKKAKTGNGDFVHQ